MSTTDPALLKRVSKHMALLLRHAPDRAGLVLDPEGYVGLDELATALGVDAATVRAVVAHVEPHKQRYAIEGDCVRANYGHSIAERIAHEAAEPPALLLHGTTRAALDAIRVQGLVPMRRQFVHLTTERALALSVGARHGPACLVTVDARAAHAAGVVFHRANHAFWLAAAVPAAYLTME